MNNCTGCKNALITNKGVWCHEHARFIIKSEKCKMYKNSAPAAENPQQLKACPFCGGKAKLQLLQSNGIVNGAISNITDIYHIVCTNCLASSMKIEIMRDLREHPDETDRTIHTSIENLISAWNARA